MDKINFFKDSNSYALIYMYLCFFIYGIGTGTLLLPYLVEKYPHYNIINYYIYSLGLPIFILFGLIWRFKKNG